MKLPFGSAVCVLSIGLSTAAAQAPISYQVLATSKTSTMQKELNEAAADGYRLVGAMGGDTAVGGHEVVAIVTREKEASARYEYRLLATNRTSTMQKEMQAAGDAGFEYRSQTVFNSSFGGEEVVVILERDEQAPVRLFEYRLLSTSRTGTMEKELNEAGASGFECVVVTVGKTAAGGNEVVAIMRRERP